MPNLKTRPRASTTRTPKGIHHRGAENAKVRMDLSWRGFDGAPLTANSARLTVNDAAGGDRPCYRRSLTPAMRDFRLKAMVLWDLLCCCHLVHEINSQWGFIARVHPETITRGEGRLSFSQKLAKITKNESLARGSLNAIGSFLVAVAMSMVVWGPCNRGCTGALRIFLAR